MTSSKSRRRGLWLLLALIVLPIGMVLLFAGALLELLHPEPADPVLVERTARSLPVRTSAPPPVADDGCTLTVRAFQESTLLPGVEVSVTPREIDASSWRLTELTDARGSIEFHGLPCVLVDVEATHPELAGSGRRGFALVPGEPTFHNARFFPTMQMYGRVTDPDGESVSEASVVIQHLGEHTQTTDADGRWSLDLPIDPTLPQQVILEVDALGFDRHTLLVRVQPEDLPATPDPTDPTDSDTMKVFEDVRAGDRLEVDVVLEPSEEVRVWCAGLPDDRCNEMLVQCTHPLSPVGQPCPRDARTGETICSCPEGPVAIRGGGRATLVEADATEAWLDFRDTGSLSGRILADGKPAAHCEVEVLRIPDGLEDLPRGVIAAQKSRCDGEGNFKIAGLVKGDWEVLVQVTVPDIGFRQRSLLPERVLPRQDSSVGDVEMLDGGVIEGRVVNGLTGEAEPNAALMAVRRGVGDERSMPGGFANTTTDGSFRMEGLPPGEWELFHVLSPHVRTTVQVDDGALTDGVVVETSDATTLETNGFSMRSSADGLVVDEVEPGSPAERAGLMPGDEVTGMLLAGFDMSSTLGRDADKLVQLVLGHWDGPGVTLLVERDGEEHEVELDW